MSGSTCQLVVLVHSESCFPFSEGYLCSDKLSLVVPGFIPPPVSEHMNKQCGQAQSREVNCFLVPLAWSPEYRYPRNTEILKYRLNLNYDNNS